MTNCSLRFTSNGVHNEHVVLTLREAEIGSLVPVVSGIEFNKVKYDALNGVVVASSANELHYYSNLGTPIGQVVNSEPIADFYFFYNK